MSKQIKVALYIIAGLAAIGFVALLWWGFGQVGAWVAALLGLGATPALQRYVKADTDAINREQRIHDQSAQEQADVDWEAKKDLAAALTKEQQRRDEIEAQATKERATVNGQMGRAKTTQELSRIEDQQLRELEAMLPPGKGESGFVRVGFCCILILVALLGMAIAGSPARARPATAADKARTAKRINVIIRAKAEIKRLKSLLEYRADTHRAQVKALKASHQVAIKRERQLRQSDRKACAAKLQALANQPCPSTRAAGTIGGVIGGVGGVLLGIAGCGIYLSSRGGARP